MATSIHSQMIRRDAFVPQLVSVSDRDAISPSNAPRGVHFLVQRDCQMCWAHMVNAHNRLQCFITGRCWPPISHVPPKWKSLFMTISLTLNNSYRLSSCTLRLCHIVTYKVVTTFCHRLANVLQVYPSRLTVTTHTPKLENCHKSWCELI